MIHFSTPALVCAVLLSWELHGTFLECRHTPTLNRHPMTLCTQGEQEIAIIDTKRKLIFTAQKSSSASFCENQCGSTFVRLLRELLTFLEQVPEQVAIIIIIIIVIVIFINRIFFCHQVDGNGPFTFLQLLAVILICTFASCSPIPLS